MARLGGLGWLASRSRGPPVGPNRRQQIQQNQHPHSRPCRNGLWDNPNHSLLLVPTSKFWVLRRSLHIGGPPFWVCMRVQRAPLAKLFLGFWPPDQTNQCRPLLHQDRVWMCFASGISFLLQENMETVGFPVSFPKKYLTKRNSPD